MRFPFSKKRITGKEYYEIRDNIDPGAVLLTSTCGELSNFINPSEWKHGGLYIGGDKVKWVIEATGKGVIVTDLVTFMLQKDKIAVYEPSGFTKDQKLQVAEESKKHIGQEYDYAFKVNNDKYYCFEFIAVMFEEYSSLKELNKYEFLDYDIYDSRTFSEDPTRFRNVVNWS
jgi:uncharacterized protein YycO